jgi:hypothetical protein
MDLFKKNQSYLQITQVSVIKKLIILFICFGIHPMLFSQVLKDVDAIFPFHENLAAVKKGNEWAFINKDGEKVIDFRSDVVSSKSATINNSYPMFVEGKCLIKKEVNDEYRYGYIDTTGNTIIEPQYLNATNFTNGFAMIIKPDVTTMGSNNVLGKKMIYSKLEEYIIDSSGKIIKFLDNSRAYIPSKTKDAPKFISKLMAPNIVAIKTKSGKWNIVKF